MASERLTRNDLIEHGVVDVQNEDIYVHGKRRIRKLPVAKIIPKRKYVESKVYPMVQFVSRKTGKNISFAVARIVYAWYMGEVPEGYSVFHIDHDPFNNDLSNLELVPINMVPARRYM